MNHEWDGQTCVKCGITAQQYLNEMEWSALFCPNANDPALPVQATTCCSFPAIVYLGGKWICESCGGPDITRNNKMQNYTVTKCTCGALKVHGENTPGHYNDCDLRKRK